MEILKIQGSENHSNVVKEPSNESSTENLKRQKPVYQSTGRDRKMAFVL